MWPCFPESHAVRCRKTAKKKIYQQYRRGVPRRDAWRSSYCRTKTSIYRVINEMRAQRILELPLDCIPNPQFDRADVDQEDFGRRCREPDAAGEKDALAQRSAAVSGQPVRGAAVESRARSPFVPEVQFLKYRAAQLRERTRSGSRAKSSVMDEIERLYDEAVATKNQIVRSNLRLVVSIAKRHVGPGG